MQQLTKEKLIEEYREAYDAIPQAALDFELSITIKTMQALAKGNPVSPAQLAKIWEIPVEQVNTILKQARENGRVEIDGQGDLVGANLSLKPTDHQVSIDDKRLFAWCAYDALYTPGVVGKPVQIVSKDPVTGERIWISMTPGGVETVRPECAMVSIVSPEANINAGPESPRCTQMLFFGSRVSAEHWRQNRDGVSILTVEEVLDIVNEFQIEPARRLGLVEMTTE